MTSWKDDRGFGFIKPRDGGDDVFVHISAFADRNRRPIGNEPVTFTLQVDTKGRPQARDVAFVDDQGHSKMPQPPGLVRASLIAGLFLAVVIGLTIVGRLPFAVLTLYSVASTAAYVAYALDKLAAQENRWRISESTLLLLGLAGGWPGALIARHTLHHKTRKQPFRQLFWGTAVLNVCALIWSVSAQGQRFLASLVGAT